MSTLTLGLLADACGAALTDHRHLPVSGLVIDSREAGPGLVFAALPGSQRDGHEFVARAADAGCAGVLVRQPVSCQVPQLLVPDVQTAMTQAATFWRQQVAARVIGVTGSSGKTTVKEMLGLVLARAFQTHVTAGNLNNHLGVPLTILRMQGSCQVAVIEMGMNHPGEIGSLARMAGPAVGVITSIHPAHLEGLGSLTAIARAKGELLEHLPVNGLAVIPAEAPARALLEGLCPCPLTTFGRQGAWHWTEQDGEGVVHGPDGSQVVLPGLLAHGDHLLDNAAAVTAVCRWLGLASHEIAVGLQGFLPPMGRGGAMASQRGPWQVIDDCYNANPGSMAASLRVLSRKAPAGHRVAVLADMLELGDAGAELHAGLAAAIRQAGVDRVFTAGPLMAALHQALLNQGDIRCFHRPDPGEWVGAIAPVLQPGDVVLVKGSRGMRLERIVQDLLGSAAMPASH